jgi:hypothetical protein
VARLLAGLVGLVAAIAAGLAVVRDATAGAVAVLAGAGAVGALALLVAARAADRDDRAVHARLYAAHLEESAAARAGAPLADLVALGLAEPAAGEEEPVAARERHA